MYVCMYVCTQDNFWKDGLIDFRFWHMIGNCHISVPFEIGPISLNSFGKLAAKPIFTFFSINLEQIKVETQGLDQSVPYSIPFNSNHCRIQLRVTVFELSLLKHEAHPAKMNFLSKPVTSRFNASLHNSITVWDMLRQLLSIVSVAAGKLLRSPPFLCMYVYMHVSI